MSRGIAGAVLAGVMMLAASACANPPGTDGDLVNEWAAMADPVGWEPKAGTCHSDFAATLYRSSHKPVECTADHRFETVHLGQFTGSAASLAAAPAPGSPELNAAWAECDAKTTEYLGGEWRSGRIWIGVSLPSAGNWSGGARWFRCEASATEDFGGSPISWKKSFKGEFGGESELKYGCFQIPKEDDADWIPVACTAGHNAEFVGVIAVNDAWADLGKNADSIHQKCRSAIAKYVGVPDNGQMKYRTGSYYSYPSQRDWESGDHGIRCHLWLSGKNLTRSLKGTGNGGLPINYA